MSHRYCQYKFHKVQSNDQNLTDTGWRPQGTSTQPTGNDSLELLNFICPSYITLNIVYNYLLHSFLFTITYFTDFTTSHPTTCNIFNITKLFETIIGIFKCHRQTLKSSNSYSLSQILTNLLQFIHRTGITIIPIFI